MTKQKRKPDLLRNLAFFSGLAFEMAAIIGLGIGSGYYLDKKIQTKIPWFTMVLGLFSVLISLYYVLTYLNKWGKKLK